MIAYQLWSCELYPSEGETAGETVKRLALGREDFMRQIEEAYPHCKYSMAVQIHDREEIKRQVRLQDKKKERLGS